MNLIAQNLPSLRKIRSKEDLKAGSFSQKKLLQRETFSYQIALQSEEDPRVHVRVESELKRCIQVFLVKDVIMDFPAHPYSTDPDYLTKEPGLMPDLLLPIEEQNGIVKLSGGLAALWVKVDLPEELPAGTYPVTLIFEQDGTVLAESRMDLAVISQRMPSQSILFSQWMHVDCIASVHQVEIYSEEHWQYIDAYLEAAAELGITNMLTPIITPPLDTNPGITRPNVQLVMMEKDGEQYRFDYSRLKRWINLCHSHGIVRFEMAHLFSQWGLASTPNIYVTEHGKETHLFGWHVPANDPSYRNFLTQFLPDLTRFLRQEGIAEQCVFHISDEPYPEHLEAYQYAHNLVAPLLEGFKIMEAVSNPYFYDAGYMDIPVTATNHIEPFLEREVPDQWVYYCTSQGEQVANRFLAMPSYRNRILGVQLYLFSITGFLQWGFNFYYSQFSLYPINPYVTTSSDRSFPSGDPFSVYPGKRKPYPSLRAMIFREALQDVDRLKRLEEKIGAAAVHDLIRQMAGQDITFSDYPRREDFLLRLMDEVTEKLEKLS